VAAICWKMASDNPALVMPFVMAGGIGGLVLALITVFKREAAPFTAPLYAVAQGVALGTISLLFESAYSGIVMNAILLTAGVFIGLLFLYMTRIIKATENFKLMVVSATIGIGIVYIVTMVLGFFGTTIPYIHESGAIGIAFSGFVVAIAALNLVLDFDFIEQGAEKGCPKYMEWYGAFGLLVTLVWLYLEILRLLSKLRSK
ncbi:MAG: Bax inhibitor-1/YccA family protein, partial [Planctomycetes bacterium]|nr:Bax inhibitor-1/YccA family protein [Planctomycetota bacterium]